jgi:hypothetical protein
MEYNFNPKVTNITTATAFTITDVSGLYGKPAGIVWRWTHDGSATLAQVRAGDLVTHYGPTASWAQNNRARISGDGLIGGLPIVSVNDTLNYFDVVNPHGKAMGSTTVGFLNTLQICPAPTIKWELRHAARVKLTSLSRSGSTVTAICSGPHFLNTGDYIDLLDSNNIVDGSYGAITVTSANQFTFTLAGSAFTETDIGSTIIKSGQVPTRYRLEKLGFNNLVRVSRHDGESPRFADCGVAVDDYVVFSGSTFRANNSGRFRVLAVTNDALIIESTQASEELNTTRVFNARGLVGAWTANTNVVTGVAGTFKNVKVGDWVKKTEDPDSYYRQVTALTPSTPALATQVTLGDSYPGSTSDSAGVAYDQLIDHDTGVTLLHVNDISIYEGDAAVVGDILYVQNIVNTSWFSPGNIGSFEISEIGTNTSTFKPFVRVSNDAGVVEASRLMSVDTSGLYIIEGIANKFSTIRKIDHVALDDLNNERRSLYVTPHNRSYKFSNSNNTSITHMGKLGYGADVTTGVDGYLYYTGLLRRVQRIVDGYEPDPENFPGRRAIGGAVETLPPLNKKIVISMDITTDEGVNLGDITNNIKSVIIGYIQGLGVGEDVILSEIIASVMQIKGVGATTFTNPTPSTERVTIADNEKATIDPTSIGIS